jgi:hypothetical protein
LQGKGGCWMKGRLLDERTVAEPRILQIEFGQLFSCPCGTLQWSMPTQDCVLG